MLTVKNSFCVNRGGNNEIDSRFATTLIHLCLKDLVMNELFQYPSTRKTKHFGSHYPAVSSLLTSTTQEKRSP
jgi:hypothetical protein